MMDISPSGLPSKKLHLGGGSGGGGYASPLNLSPCVSPLMSAPHSLLPTAASFALINSSSRKSSSTQSESTPLSSPSSLIQSSINNPFAVNYDSGNCEHWHSSHSGSASGSTCSSAGQSPPGITVNEEQKMVIMDSGPVEVSTEAPTPLSPKGLQFRQKPFNLSSSLPSPIPRTLHNGMCAPVPQGPHVHIVSANGVVGGVNSHVGLGAVGTGIAPALNQRSRSIIKPQRLHHDKLLSPFNSDLPHPHPHPHSHPHAPRPIKMATRTRILSGKGEPLRPSPANPAPSSSSPSHSFSSMELHSGSRLNSRPNSCSSPLAKLSMSSSLEDGNSGSILGGHGHAGRSTCMLNTSSGIPIHQLRATGERHLNKRRTSETSTDSQEESLMESDSEGQSIVGSLEDSVGVHLCPGDTQKPFDTKVLHTHS